MALPNRVYDDEDERQPLSARERANAAWGMTPQQDDDARETPQTEDVEDESPLSRAEKRWGEASLIENDKESERKNKQEDKDSKKDSENQDDEGFWKPSEKELTTGRIGLRGRWKAMSRTRKYLIAFGTSITIALLAGVISLVTYLLPFKVSAMIQLIEDKVGQVPEYALERRMEYYLNRYLIVRTLANELGDDLIESDREYTYIGNGVFRTLYTNWKYAKLEAKFLERGWRLEPKNGTVRDVFERRSTRPSEWHLVNLNTGERQVLNSRQARNFVKETARNETKWYRVFKRYNMRKGLMRYYGIPHWKWLEDKRERARKSFHERKTDIIRKLVNQTVGAISKRYGLYITCILEGGDRCRDNLGKRTDPNPEEPATTRTDPETGETIESGGGRDDSIRAGERPAVSRELTEEASKVVTDEFTDGAGRVGNKTASRNLTKQIQELGAKKILASFTAGIGLLDAIAQIVDTVNSGAINAVIYDKNSQQYVAYAAPIISMADQAKARDTNFDSIRALNEIFDDYQTSPVYMTQFGSRANMVAAVASKDAGQMRRDCNEDGDTDDEEDLLPPGETICKHKKILVNKTAFTDNPAWEALSKAAEIYKNSFGGIVSFFQGIVQTALEVTGLDRAIQAAMDKLGVSAALEAAFKFLLNLVAGPVITGAEVGAEAFDAVYAGLQVMHSSIAGGIGTDRADTLGGGYLSDEEVSAIHNEMAEQRHYAASQKSLKERYLSLEDPNSLATKFVLGMPNSVSDTATTLASLPKTLIANFSSLLSLPVAAQSTGNYTSNPFGVIQFGYPTDHPVFTGGEDGNGMSSEEIYEKYHCDIDDLGERQALQAQDAGMEPFQMFRNKGITFEIPTVPDPCLLEEAVADVAIRGINGTYDEGLGGGTLAQTPSGAFNIAGEDVPAQDTSHMSCPESPTVRQVEQPVDAYKNGVKYSARICYVHGVAVNAQVAANYDALFTAMKAAGFDMKGSGGWRSMEAQRELYRIAGSNTAAQPGYSNHQYGTAVDISCSGGGGPSYPQGLGRGREEFARLLNEYPCLNWVHNNSRNYGLLLQCDGQSSNGGEIRANSGGCEAWHLSPTGG